MNRTRWGWVGLAALMVVAGLGALPPEPCTITVRPGESIQAAIDAAPEGATICLAEGEWRENLVIAKGITLRGAAGGKTTITGAAEGAPVVRIEWGDAGAGEVLLTSLVVTWGRGFHGHGIRIGGHARVILQELTVEDNSLYGIWIGHFAVATVVSTVVRGNEAGGIWIGDLSHVEVVDCVIVRNNGSGVVIAGSAEVSLAGSLIASNAEYGITVHDRGCAGEGGPFAGWVTGRKNFVPWPGLEERNGRGSVCPDELGFLLTEAGGSLDRRPKPTIIPPITRGLRFVIQVQGLEEMSPLRAREIVDRLVEVISERIRLYAYTSAELRPLGHNEVEVLVPRATDPDPLRFLISQRSILGFYRVLDTSWREADLRDPEVEGRVLPSVDGTEWYLVELEPLLTGEAVETAFLRSSSYPGSPGYYVALRLTPEGADAFARVIEQLAVGDRLAIVVDEVVYSAPVISSSIISAAKGGWRAIKDSVTITGMFTLSQVERLVAVLRSGALPLDVRILEESRY